MKPTLLLSALLSCFVIQSNAQDAVTTPAPISYATQGNAAQNQSVYERELERAAVEARKMKELKAAIASSSFGPPPAPITTASQFLAANRPPMPPPSEAPEVEREEAEVPQFQNSPAPSSQPSAPTNYTPEFDLPEKNERNFFKWLKNRKSEPEYEELPPAGSSGYQPAPNPYQSAPASEAPPAPSAPSGIPDVPAMNETPSSIPEPSLPSHSRNESSEPAPIFVRRGAEAGSSEGVETATVQADSEAIVNGVLVKLFSGTKVTVLNMSGSDATVRLSDGRIGTVKRKSLSR